MPVCWPPFVKVQPVYWVLSSVFFYNIWWVLFLLLLLLLPFDRFLIFVCGILYSLAQSCRNDIKPSCELSCDRPPSSGQAGVSCRTHLSSQANTKAISTTRAPSLEHVVFTPVSRPSEPMAVVPLLIPMAMATENGQVDGSLLPTSSWLLYCHRNHHNDVPHGNSATLMWKEWMTIYQSTIIFISHQVSVTGLMYSSQISPHHNAPRPPQWPTLKLQLWEKHVIVGNVEPRGNTSNRNGCSKNWLCHLTSYLFFPSKKSKTNV